MAMETLFIYRQTFHTFGQADKTFFDQINSLHGQTSARRVYINTSIVQSAIYMVDMAIKQFEMMFEPLFNTRITRQE